MRWEVLYHVAFVDEFRRFTPSVQDEIVALTELLSAAGPSLRRPHADTLKGSRFVNMKELRFDADGGAWRLAYAFDPKRRAILLVAGDKSGVSGKRFYKGLIARADERFAAYLEELKRS
jgi:hypothetical protein